MKYAIFIAALFFTACDKNDVIETIILNESERDIVICAYSSISESVAKLEIEANSSNKWSSTNINSGKVPPTTSVNKDSIVVTFEDGKRLVYTLSISPTTKNMIYEEAYKYALEETKSSCFHRYEYIVDQEHYEKAQ